MKTFKFFITLSLSALIVGCQSSSNEDLYSFMEQEKAQRGGRIDPLPASPPYVSVIYSAAGLRAPFEIPRNVTTRQETGTPSAPPDTTRPQEYLERFNFAELSVVGSIAMNGTSWALISESNGTVHRVQAGNFLGQNHGKIVSINDTEVSVIEIVPDGQGGWIERPRSVKVQN
jgi:type IV pilus assembly protein PilP